MDNFMICLWSPAAAGGAVFVAVLAGFIDSIAGGGGPFHYPPALMAAGMSGKRAGDQ